MKEKSRFLKKVTSADGKEVWVEVTDQVATEKVSHALREKKIPDQQLAAPGTRDASLPSNLSSGRDMAALEQEDEEEEAVLRELGKRASFQARPRPRPTRKERVEPRQDQPRPSDVSSSTPEEIVSAGKRQPNPLDTLATLAVAADGPPRAASLVQPPTLVAPSATALQRASLTHPMGLPLGGLAGFAGGLGALGGFGMTTTAEILAQRRLLAAEMAVAHRSGVPASFLAGLDLPTASAAAASGLLVPPERHALPPLHMMSNAELANIVAQTRLETGRRAGLPPHLY